MKRGIEQGDDQEWLVYYYDDDHPHTFLYCYVHPFKNTPGFKAATTAATNNAYAAIPINFHIKLLALL